MNETEHKIAQLALLLQEETRARLARQYSQAQADRESAEIRPGKVYTKIDIGGSGKLMVEHATGIVYGIKAYGKVHKGHAYGTLDTTSDWYWGEYYPRPRTDADPWLVTEVSASGKTLQLQAQKAELDPTWHPDTQPGGFAGHTVNNDSQRWIITPDPDGVRTTVRLTKRGWQGARGTKFSIGTARKFYDYNF